MFSHFVLYLQYNLKLIYLQLYLHHDIHVNGLLSMIYLQYHPAYNVLK